MLENEKKKSQDVAWRYSIDLYV